MKKYIETSKLIKSINNYREGAQVALNPIDGNADYYKGKIDACKDIQEFIENFLKSPRPQSKQEWCQKDNEIIDDAIACVTRCYEKYRDNKDFYQSLHHNILDIKRGLIEVRKRLTPHRKPSDEQIRELEEVIKFELSAGLHTRAKILQTLHDDLEKL